MLTTLQLVEPTRLDGSKYEGHSAGDPDQELLLWRVTSNLASTDKHKQEHILTVEATSAPTSTLPAQPLLSPPPPLATAGYVPTTTTTAATSPGSVTTAPLPLPTAIPLGYSTTASDASSAAAAVSGLLHHHHHHLAPIPSTITNPTPLHTATPLDHPMPSSTQPPAPQPRPAPSASILPPPTPTPALPHTTHDPRMTTTPSVSSPSSSSTTSMQASTPTPTPTSVATTVVPPVSGMMMGSGPGGATEVLLVPPPEFYRVNHPLQGITIEADKVVQALATLWPQLSSTATSGPDLDRLLKCLSNPETLTLYLATRVTHAATATTTSPPDPAPAPISISLPQQQQQQQQHPIPHPPPPAVVSPSASHGSSSSLSTTTSTSCSGGLKIQEIVGSLTLVSLNLLMSTRAHIEDLVVAESCRGLGIGKALMARAMHDAVTVKKCSIIDLTSKPDRVHARHLYEALGFKIRDTGAYRYYVQQQQQQQG